MRLRLWPARLPGQLTAFMVLAVLASQAVLLVIFMQFSPDLPPDLERLAEQSSSVVREVDTAPERRQQAILEGASYGRARYWLSAGSAASDPSDPDLAPLLGHIRATLPDGASRQILATVRSAAALGASGQDVVPPLDDGQSLTVVSFAMADGRWLNVAQVNTAEESLWRPALLALLVTGAVIVIATLIVARRLTARFAELAHAAQRVGRGEMVELLPEVGPLDIRATARAFNQMQARLQRFVQDRTRMLAAISHDLRTPLTSLRLRAELLEDEEAQAHMVRTIEEMQRITDGTLAFARDESAQEDTRSVDLVALVAGTCEDLAYVGKDVMFQPTGELLYACRPDDVKRAVRNLIENAVSYGKCATVSVGSMPDGVRIFIDDEGPGIPPTEFARVFQPFVRLDKARNSASGGSGLGMSIARTVIRAHGGDIELKNRPGGGLLATLDPCHS